MTPKQLLAISICIFINTLDGFDVLVIAFAATSLAEEWDIAPKALGMLFSSGLLGMVFGSILIAPLADQLGRRPVILLCLITITAGMYASAITQSTTQLASARLFTGLGIGGMLASINTLVAEYSSLRLRSLMVSLLQAGYPIGATLGGIVSVYLIGEFGWRSLFWFGGSVSLIILPVAFWCLPESASFLFSQSDEQALEKGNRERRRLGLEPLHELPIISTTSSSSLKQIWDELRLQTILLFIAFFMLMATWYFIASWTPKLLVDAGLDIEQGISGGVVLSAGGILGAILLGYLSIDRNVMKVTRNYMFAGAFSLIIFALVSNSLTSIMLIASAMGFFVVGSMIGLYAISPQIYPPSSRNTGLGWAIGFGRFGSVLGPYIVGVLLSMSFTHQDIYILFALPMLVAMISVMIIIHIHLGNSTATIT